MTEAGLDSNLIVEVRDRQGRKYWTVFGLFDPAGVLNEGKWKLPLYPCPTKTDI